MHHNMWSMGKEQLRHDASFDDLNQSNIFFGVGAGRVIEKG